jgi:hypothetical protein
MGAYSGHVGYQGIGGTATFFERCFFTFQYLIYANTGFLRKTPEEYCGNQTATGKSTGSPDHLGK